jgi:signal transduction histidine kinase/CheY-like chemotaxis protein
MSNVVLTVSIRSEHDTVAVRQRARQIARLLGFDMQDQTRISTAVSEVARNAFNYAGGGRAEYIIEGRTSPQLFIVKISDQGPGIRDLNSILEGNYTSATGMGLGIIGARRLMDQFEIVTSPGQGTTVLLKKLLPKRAPLIREAELANLTNALALERPQDPFRELQHQNQELLAALEDIRTRQNELARLNQELEDTNRGVVALYAELDEKADHLRRADELKSRFLSDMSHEFRSPLNSILALSGLLLDRSDGDLTSEQLQQVNYVRRSAQDLLELVNDLLDLAKVEAGKVEVKPIDFEVADLFAALRGMLRPLFLNQSIDLVFDDASHLPRIYSDEGKISQILRNFISNALKFTERGEVRVSAASAPGGQIEFSVSDTGIGIAPENLDLIFREFTQVDNPIQRRVKGTGLGLPLSKKLATVLGGEVLVQSVPNVGSTFSLLVPLRHRDAVEHPAAAPVEWKPDPSLVPVLIVEDSPDMVMVYERYLAESGFQFLSASTAREAEEALERVLPRAIVLDIVLRSEHTWAFIAKLKNNPRTADIPVLVVSTIEDQAKGYHLGAAGYILKPVTREKFLRELSALTNRPRPLEVLIIDDDERDRYLLKQKIKSSAALVREASNGLEGFRAASESTPDVIFLDIRMPGMNGFDTLDLFKSETKLTAVPVIIVTSQVLSVAERVRLLEKAYAIVGKDLSGREDVLEIMHRSLSGVGTPAGR